MKFWKILMVLGTVLLLVFPAYAADMEDGGETEELWAEELQEEAEPLEEEVEPLEEEIVLLEDEVELFQWGSLTGEYTKPGEIRLFALTTQEETVYQELLAGLRAKQTPIPLSVPSGTQEEQITFFRPIFQKVVNDHPELFYVRTGFSYYYGSNFRVLPTYLSMSDAQHAAFNERVDEVVALAKEYSDSDPLAQALFVHDYLAINCAYTLVIPPDGAITNVYSAYGVLVDGDAVCQGYALAYKLILNQLGIESYMVTSNPMKHAWNLVELGGKWYHVDVTWDDSTPDRQGYAGHTYFLISDTTFQDPTHKHYGWDKTDLPLCTSTNYESGWIFNDTNYPIHYYNGNYYYVQGLSYASVYQTRSLRKSETGPTLLASITTYKNSKDYVMNGVAWVDNKLFYVTLGKEVMSCNLNTRKTQTLGTVAFTEQASADGKYAAKYDGIGVYYDSKTNEVVPVSVTRRQELGRFEVLRYPQEWDEADTTEILGITDDEKTVGVYIEGDTVATVLWVACYKNNRMVGIQQCVVTPGELNIVDLKDFSSYDSIKIMLAGDANTCSPACAAWGRVIG